jgi:hypothetical protein
VDAVIVIPVAEDEDYTRTKLTIETSGIRDAVLAADEDARVPWAEALGHLVRCEGFGIGKALDAGFRYALQLSPEWVVKSDAHVVFTEPAREMLREELRRYVVLPPHRPFDSGVVTYGLSVDYETWAWRWNHQPYRPLPCATDPVYAVHSSLVRELLSIQPYVYAVPYWGKEALDLTLTLSRMGHPVMPVEAPLVVHLYKRAWTRQRAERPCIEPWCGELRPRSAYFASMFIGSAIYALRHYREPWRHAFWHEVRDWVPAAQRYFPDRARYAELPITAEQAYAAHPV